MHHRPCCAGNGCPCTCAQGAQGGVRCHPQGDGGLPGRAFIVLAKVGSANVCVPVAASTPKEPSWPLWMGCCPRPLHQRALLEVLAPGRPEYHPGHQQIPPAPKVQLPRTPARGSVSNQSMMLVQMMPVCTAGECHAHAGQHQAANRSEVSSRWARRCTPGCSAGGPYIAHWGSQLGHECLCIITMPEF